MAKREAKLTPERVKEGGPDIVQFFQKIQEAAYVGQNGSASYSLDRLALIQALATTALERLAPRAANHETVLALLAERDRLREALKEGATCLHLALKRLSEICPNENASQEFDAAYKKYHALFAALKDTNQ